MKRYRPQKSQDEWDRLAKLSFESELTLREFAEQHDVGLSSITRARSEYLKRNTPQNPEHQQVELKSTIARTMSINGELERTRLELEVAKDEIHDLKMELANEKALRQEIQTNFNGLLRSVIKMGRE